MQFKHPELLYALFLLIVPILIHLFQLRRFQKVQFTNVKFLKAVKLQTRKSAQLKKWLTLISRLLLLTCVIIAFAQPFIPHNEDFNDAQETVIYLDNSHSMQIQGKNGTLLNEAIQDIINSFPEDETISLFTNDNTFKNTSIKALKNDLIQLKYSAKQLHYDALLLKGKQLFSNTTNATKNLVLVSDFQQKYKSLSFETDSLINFKIVQPKSEITTNVSIDSVYISNSSAETLDLNVQLSNQGEPVENVTISLFNDDTLLAKKAVDLNGKTETRFTISNSEVINGKLVIEDLGLQYDNTFYFNLNSKPKINVLAINETAEDNFLKRIYTNDEFNYTSFRLEALNFNLIPEQNLIVLNEIETISEALRTALYDFSLGGGSVLVIPAIPSELESYTRLFKTTELSAFSNLSTVEKKITTINYDHPLLKNTFYSKVDNFQYPKVNQSFNFNYNGNAVLSFEDNTAFLKESANTYAFSAALNENNSNFKNSPLIVPIFYNIGKQSLKLPQLYYTIGEANTIAINIALGQDEILTLSADEVSVIPLQKTYSKSVILETEGYPNTAGIVTVKNKAQSLQNLSFNFNRNESKLFYYDLNNFSGITLDNSLASALNDIKSSTTINALWKWFVIFALIFLIIEILLLKYLK